MKVSDVVSHYALLNKDWDILEALEAVLQVSLLLDPGLKACAYQNNRTPTLFNRACPLSQCLSYHVLSPILRHS